MSQDFADLLGSLMAERRLSIRGLTREIPVNAGQLSRVLRRVRPPSPEIAARCDVIFDTGHRLARAAEQSRLAASTPSPIPDPPLVTALVGSLQRREVNGESVRALADMVILLRRLDDEVGPAQLIDTVTTHLRMVIALLNQAAPSSPGFPALSRVAAELSQLMGWLAFDLSESDRAQRHLAAAQKAAVAAGDTALGAYALSWRGLVIGQTDPQAGLGLAHTARRLAGPDAPPSVRAWISRVEAESAAGQGDRRGTDQALDQLSWAAAQPRTERDPAWTYFISSGQIAAYRGVCYVRLAQGREAEAALTRALDDLPSAFVRDRCLYLTYMSAAHLLQQQPEAAAATASQALTLAVTTQSPRSIDRLQVINRRLSPWQHLPEVQDLGDLLTAHC